MTASRCMCHHHMANHKIDPETHVRGACAAAAMFSEGNCRCPQFEALGHGRPRAKDGGFEAIESRPSPRDQPEPLLDPPLARNSDPRTSHEAAKADREGSKREIILAVRQYGAMCSGEIAEKLPHLEGVWKRVSELKRDGLLVVVGSTVYARTGKTQELLGMVD